MAEFPAKRFPSEFGVVTQIKYPDISGHATGFFYTPDGESTYLVSNLHVFNPEENNPDEIRFFVRKHPVISDVEYITRDLYSDEGEPIWIEHPKEEEEIDLAAIRLDIDLSNYGSQALNSEAFLPNEAVLRGGRRAMIVGYPQRKSKPFIPIARSAMISSVYGAPFEGEPHFTTDANMHSGSSGSPVFTAPPHNIYNESGNVVMEPQEAGYFLGVHSAMFHSEHDDEEGAFNLNVAWYPEQVHELVTSDS